MGNSIDMYAKFFNLVFKENQNTRGENGKYRYLYKEFLLKSICFGDEKGNCAGLSMEKGIVLDKLCLY